MWVINSGKKGAPGRFDDDCLARESVSQRNPAPYALSRSQANFD